jgi:hypothetical protein
MKKMLLIAFLGLGQFVSAQITKNLGDFSTIRVFDKINVTLVKANENKIVIKGSRSGDVEVVTKNDELKVRMKLEKLLKGEDVEATVYYKVINQVEASEGSFVGSADTFNSTAFEVNTKEGSTIKLSLDVQKLKSKAASGGMLHLTGKAKNHDAIITSGGELHGRDLSTEQTTVTISAGGEADVSATDFVDAKTRAGGDINIYGNPKQVNQKSFAGGTINVRK